MSPDLMDRPLQSLSPGDRAQLRATLAQAHEAIAPCWPLKTFAYYNPLRGLEHLPFDQAVHHGQKTLGGRGYLANTEYRRLYRDGRITQQGIQRALKRVGPEEFSRDSVSIGAKAIAASDVWSVHLLFGLDPLAPSLLTWMLTHEQVTTRFRPDLPVASRQRIRQQTILECESCREEPEGTYLSNLWRAVLSVLQLDLSSVHSPGSQVLHVGEPENPASLSSSHPPSLPSNFTLGEWVGQLSGVRLVEQINEQMIKWGGTFLDEGLANWAMPLQEEGFYATWRSLATHDFTGPLLGIQGWPHKIDQLPRDPEVAIWWVLQELGLPQERWKDYLARHLAYLPGWAGFIQWRSENPQYPAQSASPIHPAQYLAVRLFYEKELVHAVCEREWAIPGTLPDLVRYWQARPDPYHQLTGEGSQAPDPREQALCRDGWRLFHLAQFLECRPLDVQELTSTEARRLLSWLDAFPAEAHGAVWLEAYEGAFQGKLMEKLRAHRDSLAAADYRPRAQLIFCIDARSECFRRHIESQGPYDTFGYAGFFGIPISHVAFDSHDHLALCPILLKPKHEVTENPRVGQSAPLERYLSGTRWQQLGHQVFHDLKFNPLSSFMLIDVLGMLFSLGLAGKTLCRRVYDRIKAACLEPMAQPVATRMVIEPEPGPDKTSALVSEGLIQGFSPEEQADFIEGGLRVIGLTHHFGRLIVACGHGSATENNPYFAAYDCGACGGSHGDPNARVFAAMGNNPDVRGLLRERGLVIPDDTWFLAGKHNTTTDRVTFYDVEDVPSTHTDDLCLLMNDLEQAGRHQALERCQRLPDVPAALTPEKAFAHVHGRGVDWANPRPEWGLSGNAAFLIGRRSLTKGLDLQGRVFLHSYDPDSDAAGGLLEKIMTAPLIVGELISLTYYFSTVDPWVYGCGSKVIHNVVSGVGVMLGSQSDLQRGLPLQSVNDGGKRYHEPMRLLAIIEAPPSRISSIIHKHTLLQHLFHHRWMNLLAIDPATGEFYRYHPDATWESESLKAVEAAV